MANVISMSTISVNIMSMKVKNKNQIWPPVYLCLKSVRVD
jgi:hypothetical protein